MLATQSSLCKCVYSWNLYNSYSTVSIVLEFLISLVLVTIGLLVNFKFKKKFEEERRARPLGRKGNVIEPIMRWYQIVAMAFWTYILLFLWLWNHEILPSEWFTNCWLLNITGNIIMVGRSVVAYNSFFIALIRYIYIVHHERAHLWDFDKVGKIFQIVSVSFPVAMELIRVFTEEELFFTNGVKSTEKFLTCLAINENWNDTTTIVPPQSVAAELTLKLLPRTILMTIYGIWLAITTLIYSNIVEGYLYVKIFQTIRR